MIMNNEFDNTIRELEQEIIDLRSCPIKTSTQLQTKSVEQSVSFDMVYVAQLLPNFCWGDETIVITMTSTDGTNMLTDCVLKNSDDAAGHNLAARSITIMRTDCGATSQYKIHLVSRNTTDIQKLSQGQQVILNYTLVLTSTSDFTISITTEPYQPF